MAPKTHREAPEMAAFLRRTLKAMARRAAEGDDQALVELVALQGDLTAAIDAAAVGLHDGHGYSWTELGDRLGITRQGARQRFAS